jgi:circadian clock protein KaiC
MNEVVAKAPTGIYGLDEITGGGLPRGRVTLVTGGPGCGKTLLSTEFLVRGAQEFGEPGVFMTFEETGTELAQNVASLGFDLNDLVERNLLSIDYVRAVPREIVETGEYDLEGLFLRLGAAIDRLGARRVVLDTPEALFSGLQNERILRTELQRLFHWLKERGLTAVVTAERGDGTLTRHGLEEYISDCVITLDHRVTHQISTRRLRIIKYRGSRHGTNEYPFLINDEGLSVLPITSLGLNHQAKTERISTGVSGLDEMLDGKGFFRGTSILITGTAGTGKTSLAAHFVDSVCRRGEKCLYLAFEESPAQLMRNMRSIGIDLRPWIDQGLLHMHAARPSLQGLEMHLVGIHRLVSRHEPAAVILDPVSNLVDVGDPLEVESVLTRLIDFLKVKGITSIFTSLTPGGSNPEHTDVGISSLMDAWILVKVIESNGERNRGLYVLKSRGMAHSNQIREMRITENGVDLVEAYLGLGNVLTGAARSVQENRDRAAALERAQERVRRRRELERKRYVLNSQIAALRAEFEAEEAEVQELLQQDEDREALLSESKTAVSRLRHHRSTDGSSEPP